MTAAATAPLWCCQKIYLFTKKVDKIGFECKSMFFALSHFDNFFVTHGHIPAIFNFLDLILSELSHSQSPSILKHIFKVWKPKRKLILYYGKVKETYFTSVKKAQVFIIFKDLKLSDKKTIIKNPNFFRVSESCMSQLWLGTKVNPEIFLILGATICSTLWD